MNVPGSTADWYTQKIKSMRAIMQSTSAHQQSTRITSFLRIDPASIQNGGNRLNTYAFLDIESTVSNSIKQDQCVQEKLGAQSTDVTLKKAGYTEQSIEKKEKVFLRIKGLQSKVRSIEAFLHPSNKLENAN